MVGADWSSPAALERCLTAADVRNARGMPLIVREERALREYGESGYEPRILDHGVIAVRPDRWHDVFNVLVWRTFPRAKAALNERHCAELDRHPGGPYQRGALRDTLTLVDESGVIVAASDGSLLDALRGFRWKELFWSRRADLLRCLRVHVFGHALYEKLLRPYVGLTGHAIVFEVDQALIEGSVADRIRALDHRLAAVLRECAGLRSPRDLHPVPLLGVPGWHPGAAHETFYDNRDYFRPGRRPRRALVGRIGGRS
jgi:Protein of unknown function (DUF3025)